MKHILTLGIFLLAAVLPPAAQAQAARTFKGRLAPMPLDLAMAPNIAGHGSMTASLAGAKLTLTATFEGLKSQATAARLKKSPKPGMRGEPVADLVVTPAMAGQITATLDLTPQQVAELQAGRYYVQIDSEKAPDGNLWGWLLPQETKR
jgi:hypothetical protein